MGASFFFVDSGAEVSLPSLYKHQFPPLRCLAVARLKKYGADAEKIRLTDLIVAMHEVASAPNRFRTPGPHARHWIRAIFDACHFQLEVSLDEDWWQEARLLDLPVKRSPTGKHLNFPGAYKAEVLLTTREMPTTTTSAQYMASASVAFGSSSTEVGSEGALEIQRSRPPEDYCLFAGKSGEWGTGPG